MCINVGGSVRGLELDCGSIGLLENGETVTLNGRELLTVSSSKASLQRQDEHR